MEISICVEICAFGKVVRDFWYIGKVVKNGENIMWFDDVSIFAWIQGRFFSELAFWSENNTLKWHFNKKSILNIRGASNTFSNSDR